MLKLVSNLSYMKRYAIAVVILPPDTIMDLALEWNRALRKPRPTNIVLDKMYHLPHVSMAMGCLPANQLERANAILKSLATQYRALELRVPHIKTVPTAAGDNVISFDIELSLDLAGLHESILSAFRPLLTQDASEADINDMPPIEPSTLDWINHYIPHYCLQHFWPHITLGFGVALPNFQPFSFQASRLAICHLGNHCTCTGILGEVFLKSL